MTLIRSRPVVSSRRPCAPGLLLAAGLAMGLAPGARAQDSVSNANTGLLDGGDAPSAFTTNAQILNYVVDLPIQSTSWKNNYRLGILTKASRSTSSGYFNHLIASQAASAKFDTGNFVRPSYSAWRGLGQGVTLYNNAPTSDGSGLYGTLSPLAVYTQNFATAFLEFSGGPNTSFGDYDDDNDVVTSLVSLWPRNTSRLYVSRVVAAINRPAAGTGTSNEGNSSLGLGGIDPAGNVAISADGYGMRNSLRITNKKLFRVASSSRPAALNQLTELGGDASTRLLLSVDNAQTTPLILPTSVAGRPTMLGADLANNYLAETTANATLTSSATPLAPSGASARGPLGYSAKVFSRIASGSGDAGTLAVLSRASSATRTRGIEVMNVKNDGSVSSTARYELPTALGQILDNELPGSPWDPMATFGSLGSQEFTNYQSQVVFRGPNAPVACVVLPSGDLLAAAAVSATGSGVATPQSQDGYIAVLSVRASDGVASWSVAAHTGDINGYAGGLSKQVLGRSSLGSGLSRIGALARASEVNPAATTGPSLSAPALDAAGNIYFIANVLLDGSPAPTPTTALLRASRNAGTGVYQLELITKIGDTFAGINSQCNYQIQSLALADADSIDSGTVFAGSIVQDTLTGVDLSQQNSDNPLTLGALVFRAKVVYDRNADAQYADPSTPLGAGALDEAYNVQMILMPRRLTADLASASGTLGPDGQITGSDVVAFFQAFFGGNTAVADIADGSGNLIGDGLITGSDVVAFFQAFFGGN